jgi:NAD(P)H-dependent FMN reductase
MLETPKILAFAGSLRTGSFNKQLIRIAVDAARGAGAEVTLIDLLDFPLPVLNQDDEAAHGLPANARKLKELFKSHHGFMIASPEYNSSIPGVLKNVIDWVSRAEPADEPPLIAYKGKTCALMSASPGALGGLRALVHVRAILGNIGVFVLPGQVCIPTADQLFNSDGSLNDLQKTAAVRALARSLVEVTRKMEPPTVQTGS